jgi:hypothetical protein
MKKFVFIFLQFVAIHCIAQSQDLSAMRILGKTEYAASELVNKNIFDANNEIYTRFRTTQAFQELDDEVKKFDEWKKEQEKTP